MDKQIVKISKSDFSEKFLYLKGEHFSLSDYPHLRAIYDTAAKEVVLKFSRQTAKSTTLANIIISSAAMNPHYSLLYCAPRVSQTKTFSRDRVAPVMEGSPILKEYYMNSTLTQNVFFKQFLNGSHMYFTYALLSADAIRGISSDQCFFDEVQDLKPDVIPVVQETMSRSLHKVSWFAGTPKTTRGTLAQLWYRSSMNEYAIKCSGCSHWNILMEENIGLKGPICSKCGKLINLKGQAEWVSTYQTGDIPTTEGYRVCILHFANAPWVDWELDVIKKRENSPSKAIFYNESLALEHDEGIAPITKMQLQACCNHERPLTQEPQPHDFGYPNIIMGVDYGPINSENSNTVCIVVQNTTDKYKVLYMKKFVGKEADYSFIHKELPRLKKLWRCSHIAADYGMGEASNAEIREKVGYDKLIAFQHMREQKEKVKWNSKMPAYTLGRTQVMTDIFTLIKQKKIEFPAWGYVEPFLEDILNIQMEQDEILGKTKYINIGPDDFFHALLYAILSLEMLQGNSLLT